jgi:hypothetical protein
MGRKRGNQLFDLSSRADIDLLLSVLVKEQEAIAAISTERLVQLTNSFLGDALKLKTYLRKQSLIDVIDFVRFVAATGVVTHCVGTSQLNRAITWILSSLNDDTIDEQTAPKVRIYPERLHRFLGSEHRSLRANAAQIICTWATFAYSYYHVMRTADEAVFATLDPCTAAINECFPAGESISALLTIATWAIDNAPDIARKLALRIEGVCLTGQADNIPGFPVALATRLGNHTQRGRAHWLEICEKLAEQLSPAERLQVFLIKTAELDIYDQRRDELYTLIDKLRPPQDAPLAALEQHRERSFSVLGTLLIDLVRAGRSKEALALTAHFYAIPAEKALQDAIFSFPFTTKGALWGREAEIIEIDVSQEDRDEAVAAMNFALGTAIGIKNDQDIPERLGIPNEAFALSMVEATARLLGLDGFHPAMFTEEVACLPFSSTPLPFQAALLARHSKAWPFAVSLQRRLEDKPIRRVVVWRHGLLHSDEEISAIKTMFMANDRVVEVHESAGANARQRFLKLYRDAEVDVFWVIGHGEHVPAAPDENHLVIFDGDESIRATELAGAIPSSNSRRLLVLNVCSGAKPTGYASGLPRLSIAAVNACQQQAVISHLWPVWPKPALAFGSLLASQLATDHGFFKAYCNTVLSMQAGTASVTATLEGLGLKEQAAIIAGGDELTKPLSSYSAAFFE